MLYYVYSVSGVCVLESAGELEESESSSEESEEEEQQDRRPVRREGRREEEREDESERRGRGGVKGVREEGWECGREGERE